MSPVQWPPQFYEYLLSRVPEPLLIVDATGQTLFCSQKVLALFDVSEAQLKEVSIVNWLPDWFTLPVTTSVLESIAKDANGRVFAIEINITVVETPSGPVLISVLRDSSRWRAETDYLSAERENLREQVQELNLRERDLVFRFPE